ncbi:MAG: 30S ribosomal protein S9 [Candidatus Aminicenantes bacterium]|nr:30S ribosomal protein S9 [Candidatus Aminicenantes bacterium]MDH5385272.1 30S ribosomal protein S9 [Candidatus Aminicenantes bacterium]MDH5742167.1 30S ribosomal protein S9 [Candidatus Aminicenantes bacterium]
MSLIQYYGTGKRKTSVARVFLRPGKGDVTLFVDKRPRPFIEYFSLESHKHVIRQPLLLTDTEKKFDLLIRVNGGGASGQAEAIRLGIARALVEFNKELKSTLKSAGLLTRDARIKERKKYGLLGARKAPQYHKR